MIRGFNGIIAREKVCRCPVCTGTGYRKDEKTALIRMCRACDGTGKITKIKQL